MLVPKRGVGQTTVPESGRDRGGAGESGLVIRWLFPATDGPVTPLSSPRIVLGRGDDCGTTLPGAEVSRYHAEIVRVGPVAVLRDLGSTNGTFVNGQAAREAPLARGHVVRLGEWVGVVVAAGPAGGGAAAHGTIAPGLFGGPALRAVLEPALRVAESDLPIIVEGETGTGKEVVARAIHARSGRAGGFLAVNCAALPETLAEAELFGYRRGAFTGAERASPGHFRAAHGGTLLLDEITDLALPLQAKILRVLEQREVTPLGESQPIPIDTRVVAAAQGSLEQAVAEKRFRVDLFARLDGVTVRLPPLRERIEDVPYLFARLLHDLSGGRPPAVEPKLVERLCLYDWPLNVRELVMLARRLLVMHGPDHSLKVGDLPRRVRGEEPSADPAADGAASDGVDRDAVDAMRLVAALRAHGGNVSRAAAAIGVSRQRAYRLIQGQADLDLEGLRGGLDGVRGDVDGARGAHEKPRDRTP
jgi:transcriptional regulator with AAA-type ATPase domain